MTPKPSFLFKDYLRAAIREGRKTQTRRVLSPRNTLIDGRAPKKGEFNRLTITGRADGQFVAVVADGPRDTTGKIHMLTPHVRAGDVWYMMEPTRRNGSMMAYRDDGSCGAWLDNGNGGWFWNKHGWIHGYSREYGSYYGEEAYGPKWCSSMFMPRDFARTFMLVLRVWPERIQDISEEDAMAEMGGDGAGIVNAIGHFHELWDTINAHRPGCSWADNPPVWAHEWRLITREEAYR